MPGEHAMWGMHRIKCANGYAATGATCVHRHQGGGANVVFADGHAAFLTGGKIVGGTSLPCETPVINPTKETCK